MRSVEFIKKLEISRNAVFSFSDLVRILGKDKNYSKVFIHRLTKRGLLRLERNKYTLQGMNPFLIASNLIFPSYLSFISAYSYYNVTTQLPKIFYVVSLKQKKPVKYGINLIHFIKFDKSKFFGFKRELLENKFIFIAELEKAIIDSLYLPRYCPISETYYVLQNAKLDIKKLILFTQRIKSLAISARLGYLLELIGIDVSRELNLPKNYILLNPSLSKKGEKNKKWKLIINEVLE